MPSPNLDVPNDIAGAYVSCWIEATSIDKASTIAKQEIQSLKWEIVKKEEAYRLNEDSYSANATGFQFYKQALIDKWGLKFHTYPKSQA